MLLYACDAAFLKLFGEKESFWVERGYLVVPLCFGSALYARVPVPRSEVVLCTGVVIEDLRLPKDVKNIYTLDHA